MEHKQAKELSYTPTRLLWKEEAEVEVSVSDQKSYILQSTLFFFPNFFSK